MTITTRLLMTTLLLAFAGGCTSVKKDGEINSRMDPDRVEVRMDNDELKKAAQSPLYDFNLKRDKIPARLSNIDDTYDEPPSCRAAREEAAALTEILGPDPATRKKQKNSKIKVNPANAIGSAVSSYIPYNNVVRFLSGADSHRKKYADAIMKGHLRRSFVNGWLIQNDCPNVPVPKLKPVR